ncbi:MAG: hypothetical protein NVSMB39_1000 [Candidatus Saccharimonadales bacterium]
MTETPENPTAPSAPDRLTHILRWIVWSILGLTVLAGGALAVAYFTSHQSIRRPAHDHFHFRLQMIVDSKPVNFADSKFQTEFNKDICTADITKQPVHFHDQLDQFVHIHWEGITGGLLLKDYGWNLIGGADSTLGYRFDQLPKVTAVPVHGQDLPKAAAGDKYFIYTGDDSGYKQRDWNDFLHSSLRDFFAGKKTALLNGIVPAAYAAGADEETLTKLNDVVGSAVIFVQKDAPTNAQIKDRFAHLVPLPASVCGG